MFSNFSMPNDTELANQVLVEERQYRWGSFDSADALALVPPIPHLPLSFAHTLQGLSIRKRFRSTPRHLKENRGCLISIQTIAGHTLFSCTVGDLGHPSGSGAVVSLDSWSCLEGMVAVVKRVGHSSFYVEKGMSAMGKTPKQLGVEGSDVRICGGGEWHSHFFPFHSLKMVSTHAEFLVQLFQSGLRYRDRLYQSSKCPQKPDTKALF